MTRYADDFVIQCRTREEAENALELVKEWTANAGLQLHSEKTRIADANGEGFDFLGYHFQKGRKWPRKKSIDKFRDGIRSLTRRTSGHSMEELVAKLNPKLRGWFNYFKHSCKNTFKMRTAGSVAACAPYSGGGLAAWAMDAAAAIRAGLTPSSPPMGFSP